MTSFELDAVIRQINNNYQNSWEQTRIIASHFVNCFSDKPIKPHELIPFSWDKVEVKKIVRPSITPEKIKTMEDLVNNLN